MFLRILCCFFNPELEDPNREYFYSEIIINTDYIKSIESVDLWDVYAEAHDGLDKNDCRAFKTLVNLGDFGASSIDFGNYSFYTPYDLSEWQGFLSRKEYPYLSDWPKMPVIYQSLMNHK